MLDGQMAVLEDYLEVRPQRAAELQAHCRQGRIQVGPWYVLADEFLVSPEALIRNLMVGHRMGEDYGGVMKIGYVPDGFGHIAQLPQILRGFGIDNAFFWRGMGAEGDRLGTEFEWCAPDGSSVTTILMPWGYHNVTNLGYPIHWGDVSQMEFSGELAQRRSQRAGGLKPMANTPALLLMNGIDHAEAEPRIPEIIARANAEQSTKSSSCTARWPSTWRGVAPSVKLPEFEGEFRWGRYSEILQGVYSTRIHLKQINHRVETLLGTLHRAADRLGLAFRRGRAGGHAGPDLDGVALAAEQPPARRHLRQRHRRGAPRNALPLQPGGADRPLPVRDSLRQIARQVDSRRRPASPCWSSIR